MENICLSEGPVLAIAIFQVEIGRDLDLQMHKDFLNSEFKMCKDLDLQMSRDIYRASNAQKFNHNFKSAKIKLQIHSFKCAEI